jgi:hypothetical protein
MPQEFADFSQCRTTVLTACELLKLNAGACPLKNTHLLFDRGRPFFR